MPEALSSMSTFLGAHSSGVSAHLAFQFGILHLAPQHVQQIEQPPYFRYCSPRYRRGF